MKYDSEKQLSIYSKKEMYGGKTAKTAFRLLQKEGNRGLIEAQLFTGRKHQIRATLSYYQTPIINDFRYGGQKVNQAKMIYLKAYKLIFQDLPAPLSYLSGKSFEIPWPHPFD